MAATALAEKYQALGFRIIEGGKSGKLVILNTAAVAEIFGRQHQHVMRSVREQQKILGPFLDQGFAEHCQPAIYRARDGKDQPCFNLTRIGFITIALAWDAPLRFLLALAFDAMETGTESDQLISQINARIRELRSRASGQDELILELPQVEPRDATQRHLEVLVGEAHTPRAYADEQTLDDDAALAARIRTAFDDALQSMPGRGLVLVQSKRQGDPRRDDVWCDRHDGVEWVIRKGRDEDGVVNFYGYTRIPHIECSTEGSWWLPYINGRCVELHMSHITPFEIVERTYLNQLPDGIAKNGARRWLLDFLV